MSKSELYFNVFLFHMNLIKQYPNLLMSRPSYTLCIVTQPVVALKIKIIILFPKNCMCTDLALN